MPGILSSLSLHFIYSIIIVKCVSEIPIVSVKMCLFCLADRCVLICLLFRAIYHRIAIFFVMQILCIVIGASASGIVHFCTILFINAMLTMLWMQNVVLQQHQHKHQQHWHHRQQQLRRCSMDCVSNCECTECKRSPRDTSHCETSRMTLIKGIPSMTHYSTVPN